MRLVNTDNPNLKSHNVYRNVKQPMPIYHSTEELQLNESEFTIIKKEDLFEEYKAITFPKDSYFHPINGNTFVSTNEKYVPQSFTREGFVIYEIVNMKPRMTDDCYVKLYGIQYMPGGARQLITSTGLWNLRPECNISAAVPPVIMDERSWNMKLNREVRAKSVEKLKYKLKNSKKSTIMDYKFISKLLNPLSGDFFLNPMLAAKASYRPNATVMSAKELMEVLASERVQKLILKELGDYMPELAKAIQSQTNPEAVATMLHDIATQAIKKPDASVEDKLLSVQAILNAGYVEEGITLNPPREQLGIVAPGFGQPAQQQNLIPFETPKIMGGTEVENESKPNPNMSDEDYKKAKEETGSMDGYTFEEIEDAQAPAN